MTDAASPKTQRRALAVRSPRHKAMLSKSARQCGDGRGTALTWCDPDLCGRTNPDATPIFALYQTLGVATWRNGMRKLLLTAAMIGFVTPALAQDAKVITPTMLTWKDNPGIPKGGQIAILVGDPMKTGDTVVQRVLFPANYAVPPHTHPYSETVTVISGEVGFGMGDKPQQHRVVPVEVP